MQDASVHCWEAHQALDSVGTPVNEASFDKVGGSSGAETDSIDGWEESVEGDDVMVDIPVLEDPVEMHFPRAATLREES